MDDFKDFFVTADERETCLWCRLCPVDPDDPADFWADNPVDVPDILQGCRRHHERVHGAPDDDV